jgi:hypothetical protein
MLKVVGNYSPAKRLLKNMKGLILESVHTVGKYRSIEIDESHCLISRLSILISGVDLSSMILNNFNN